MARKLRQGRRHRAREGLARRGGAGPGPAGPRRRRGGGRLWPWRPSTWPSASTSARRPSVVDTADVPPFTLGLADCLQAAVSGRREFQVARAVRAGGPGRHAAWPAPTSPRASWPRATSWTSSSPARAATPTWPWASSSWSGGCSRAASGSRSCAWPTRASARPWPRPTRSRTPSPSRSTRPTASWSPRARGSIAPARRWTRRGRPTGWCVARSRQGDATPAELTDAEAGLTRAEQDYANSVYDYLTALDRLEYAMGTTPTPHDGRSQP